MTGFDVPWTETTRQLGSADGIDPNRAPALHERRSRHTRLELAVAVVTILGVSLNCLLEVVSKSRLQPVELQVSEPKACTFAVESNPK